MKYLKIFDKDHTLIDEVDEQTGLTYSWVLNGMGKAEFNFPLESVKCTEVNFRFYNMVEVWEENLPIWGGIIVDLSFDEPTLHVSCYGYATLIDNLCMDWNSVGMPLHVACMLYVNDIPGHKVVTKIIPENSLTVGISFQRSDTALKRVSTLCEQSGYDFEVDVNRQFNLYQRKGSVKDYYVLEYGGEADNIISKPTLHTTAIGMKNRIHAYSGYMTSFVEDARSIELYGAQAIYYDAPVELSDQSTLEIIANAELQKNSYPIESISLTIVDSDLCPFSGVEVGDSVTVSLKPYWGFKKVLRILEITHNEDNGTRTLVVGQSIFRPQPPQKKLYVRG